MEIKITFERDDDLCGCEITKDGETVFWENLNEKEQIKVINALGNFYKLFYRSFKEK